jgi:hypothetical protein
MSVVPWLVAAPAARLQGQSEGTQLVPNGAEFQVNTYTLGAQSLAHVVADSTGGFLAVWESTGQDGSGRGVFAQRFNSIGERRGTEFQVSTYTQSHQASPVTTFTDGNQFVVAWQDSAASATRGLLLDTAGVRAGSEFQVNSSESFDAGGRLALVPIPGAGFIVVWEGYDPSGIPAILARRFLGSQPADLEFQVNPTDQLEPGAPSVDAGTTGSIFIAWDARLEGIDDLSVFARRYDSLANPVGSAFQVAESEPPSARSNPAVAADSAAGFAVAWSSPYVDGQDAGIFARRYENGESRGAEFQANTYTRGAQTFPVAATDIDDGFIILWTSAPPFEPLGQDGSGRGVFGQQYDSMGRSVGIEFQVNAYTVSSQQVPALATSSNGEFLVVWQSFGQDGDADGIFAQRFGQPSPTPTPTNTPTVTPTPTVTRTGTSTATPTALPPCAGDCNLDRIVTVDELVTGIEIALAQARFNSCRAVDSNGNFRVTIAELTTAVRNSLHGCPKP